MQFSCPSATPHGPGNHFRKQRPLAGARLEVTPLRRAGLPVLRQVSTFVHAVATTPVEPLHPVALPNGPGQAGFQRPGLPR